jgi:outer membrane receptor protein involved in Fe transport
MAPHMPLELCSGKARWPADPEARRPASRRSLIRSSGRRTGEAPVGSPLEPPGGGPLLPAITTPYLALLATGVAAAAAGEGVDAVAVAGPLSTSDEVGLVVVVEEEADDGTDPGDTAATVTVIEVDESVPASADVAAVVDSASGTVVRRLGGLGDYASVSIRGSSARQVQVFLDGVPLNPDGSQAVNLSELPLSAFERVEIYRGSAPAELAAAPLGGVVNMVTGDVPTVLTLGYGSHGTGRLVGSTGVPGPFSVAAARRDEQGSGPTDDLLVLAELFTTRGDYEAFTDNGTLYNQDDDGTVVRANNDKRQGSSLLRYRLAGDLLELSLADSFLAREEGLPGPITSPTSAARLATLRNLASARLEARFGQIRSNALAWHQLRGEELDDRAGEIGVGQQWQHYRTSTTGLSLHGSWGLRSWLVPSLTLSARQDGFVQQDLLLDISEDPRRRRAASAAASVSLRAWGDRLLLEPVMQASALDNRLLGTVPFSDSAVAPEGEDTMLVPTPRVGLLIRPWLPGEEPDLDAPWTGLAFKANAGRFFRPPDFTELFGDRGGVVGNTELLPEQGWQADLGARWAMPSRWSITGSMDVAWFRTMVTDQIFYVQNGQQSSVPINLGRAFTQGIEAAMALDLLGWLDSQSNLTWTQSRNLTPQQDVINNQLPRVPAWEVYQGSSVHWEEHLRVGHRWSYTDGNYQDATNWYLSPPRSIHGLFVRGSVRGWSLELSVLNLLDNTVALVDRNPLSDQDDTLVPQPITDFFGYPLPGRSFLLTVAWSEQPAGDP